MIKTFKKYFVPHKQNNHRPHFLRGRTIFTMTILTVILLIASVIGNYAVKKIHFLASIQSAFLVDLANEDRSTLGLKDLSINDKLVEAAQMKANDMAEKSYFAHISPDGKTPWYWIKQSGYTYVYAGENLAVNFFDSEDVEDAWMNSPTHKANILNNHYTEIGIATAPGMYKGKKTTFVVQMFASPKKSAVVSTVENTLTPKRAEASELAVDESFPQSETVVSDAGSVMTFVNPEATSVELSQTAEANNGTAEKIVYTNWFERMLVSPSLVVHYVYVVLASLIVFSLILKIFIEIRLQHPKNIAYGILLLVVVLFFMYVNRSILVNPTIVMGA